MSPAEASAGFLFFYRLKAYAPPHLQFRHDVLDRRILIANRAPTTHTPIACWIAFAMASVWRRMTSSVSASIITRASFSVPE